MRFASMLLGICLLIVACGAGVQSFVDGRVSALARPHAERVETSLGEVSALRVLGHSDGGSAFSIKSARAITSVLRRDCSDAWTFGLGARLELNELNAQLTVSTRKHMQLRAGSACLDVDWEGIFGEQKVEVTQGEPIATSGFCGPEISDASFSWSASGRVHLEVSLRDSSRCLQKLSFLAPQYPSDLVPEQVHVRFNLENVEWNKPELKGSSAVALVAELSRRFEDADLNLNLDWKASSGEKVSACLRREIFDGYSEFEIDLGLSEESLLAMTRPFVSNDNRRVLLDLRTPLAGCDGSSGGLTFSSDLHEVRQRGKKLERRKETALSAPGFRTMQCGTNEESECRYHFGIIQLGENGRLSRPAQLEAIARAGRGRKNVKPLVLVFIHGWRHDASPLDQNLREFEDFVRTAAARMSERPSEVQRQVFGVYISWPGRLYDSLSANKLATFWNRLEVARALGAPSGDLQLVLQRLAEDLQRVGESEAGEMIAFAHSMGADPLLQAVSRMSPKETSGQLVILINPAVSMARWRHLRPQGTSAGSPLLSYGSEADQVTQQLFPLGEAIQFEGQTRDALVAFSTTMNNVPALVDKRLKPGAQGLEICETRQPTRCVRAEEVALGRQGVTIISVDGSIIPSHADFMTPAFAEHLLTVALGRPSLSP